MADFLEVDYRAQPSGYDSYKHRPLLSYGLRRASLPEITAGNHYWPCGAEI